MISTILIAFASLVALMVIHEFGHFILAKKFGVKVEEFAIGYPPRLFAKRVGETVYSLNLVPFGAFVRIKGEEKSIEDPRSFSTKPIWQRCLIVLGGVLSFWLLAAILLTVVAGFTAEDLPFWQAPVKGILATGELTWLIVKGLSLALVNALRGLPTGVQMMGPVGVFSLFAKASAQGVLFFCYFAAVIAIHLALINIFPIPALDGGKLLFLAIEKVRGRPIEQKVERRITGFFFTLLLGLIAWLTIRDIIRIF